MTFAERTQAEARCFWMCVMCGGMLGLLGAGSAFAITPLERDLKKVERYMNDGFCEDALNLAVDLSKKKEGQGNFEVLFGILQAQFCLHDVGATLATAAQIRKEVTLDPGQELSLNTFIRTKVESSFGELRLSLPGDKAATVELEIKKVDALKDPTLDPFFENVREMAERGIAVPTKLYLPFGNFEIDQVERAIEESRGISFVIGKEKLSKWKRSQVGDGQLLGFGLLSFSGFGGLAHTQPGDEGLTFVREQRLSFSTTPYLELSTTHSTRLGTMGIVGMRIDVRLRPPAAFLGGTVSRESTVLTPSYYSGALSIHLAIPGPKGLNVNGGFGVRGSYLEYVQYLGNLTVPSDTGETLLPSGIDVGSLGIGPELTVGSGWAFKAGESGVQVGIELQAGITVVRPMSRTGTITYWEAGSDNSGEEYEYELTNEGVLWGPHVGGMLFVRTPFF